MASSAALACIGRPEPEPRRSLQDPGRVIAIPLAFMAGPKPQLSISLFAWVPLWLYNCCTTWSPMQGWTRLAAEACP